MKKLLIFGLVCTLCLTGCGGKKLTCTMEEKEDGMKMSSKVVLTFDKKGEEINKGSYSMDIEVNDEMAEYFDELTKYMEEEFEDIKDIANVKTASKDNTFSIKVSYNVDKLTAEQKDELRSAGVFGNTDYEETKEMYEEDGYTCK